MKRHTARKMFPLVSLAAGAFCLLAAGCATSYGKGLTSQGRKVYLGPLPVQGTESYQAYIRSSRTEVAKQKYLFQRLKSASDVEFYHNGSWYSPLEAYRGGMWLMRKRYQKGQDTRTFIRKYVERAENSGQLHLVRYPDGSVHIGSYVLYNELDLLEDTAAREPPGLEEVFAGSQKTG